MISPGECPLRQTKNLPAITCGQALSFKVNAVHLSSTAAHKRYPCRWLDLGNPAAHEKFHLMLLPSGPDMVHGFPLRRTQTSTLRARGRPCIQTASERNSVLLERIAGYRTPLPSHLARHLLVYEYSLKKSIRKLY
ncbi:hypothetical protein BN1080_00055 [Planococcus massiliensis]|uniref:Uncharacterized protein n=1 Tax=Planococcus massiliensis TaxID=1499687 RepID=A0A098EH74_9BACL|nr:hypothetical protein BN1080_00055 [Planococcus massiliensis]